MQVEKIKVNMLGGFSVWVNGESLVERAPKITKPWQLFSYLVMHREKFVPSRRLISMLWTDDDLPDPANVLKKVVYSLRKELCGGESLTDGPILYSSGGYRFNPAVKLDLDVDHFKELCTGDATGETSLEAHRSRYEAALKAYEGDLLPQLDQELWVVPLAMEYRQLYLRCAGEYCELLWKNSLFKEQLEVATAANAIEPVDEASAVYLFRALDALHMYRVIVTTYGRMVQQYEDTLGGQPPTEVRRIYASASERINKTEQDIIIIKAELAGGEEDSRPQKGAYFCAYGALKHMCRLMRRNAERSGQVVVLALFTMQPPKDSRNMDDELARAMAEFKVVAMNNLRKVDALSRYSRNQYVVLMTVNSLKDGRFVRDRILEKFSAVMASRRMQMDVKLTEV